MNPTDIVSFIERLGAQRALGYLLIASAIFAPSILSLFWFDRELFMALSTTKLLVLSGAIGAIACLSVSYAIAKFGEEEYSDKQAIVLICAVGLTFQLGAIALTWIFSIAALVAGVHAGFRSTAGFAILAILMGLSCSIYGLRKRSSTDD